MGPVSTKADLESALAGRFGSYLKFREKPAPRMLSTGIPDVDALAGGIPRGAISEIFGPASSGRTTLLFSILAQATAHLEACALVDVSDAFDPITAAAAGVRLDQLLWVRCAGKSQHALKVLDLIVHGGGFGLVVLDLGDIAPRDARRIPMAHWFRFQRAIENTPTGLILMGHEANAKTCASLVLEMHARDTGGVWSGAPGCSLLLSGARFEVHRRKPVQAAAPIASRRAPSRAESAAFGVNGLWLIARGT